MHSTREKTTKFGHLRKTRKKNNENIIILSESATQKENPGRFDRIKIAQIHSIKLPDPFGTQSTSQAVLEKT
jgi:hypothetical protein